MDALTLRLGESDHRKRLTCYIVADPLRGEPMVVCLGIKLNPLDIADCARCGTPKADEAMGLVTVRCFSNHGVEINLVVLPILGKVITDIGVGYTSNYFATILEAWEARC